MKKSILWFGLYLLMIMCLVACGGGNKGEVIDDNGEVNPPDSTETFEVTGPETWSMTANGSGSDTLTFSKTSDALSWVDYNNANGTGISYMIWSRMLLKYPITQGETWSESGGSNGYTLDSTIIVEDTDAQVVVKAGTFNSCIVSTEVTSVDPAYNSGMYIEVRKRYFAPAVGLVKVEDTWHTGEVTTGELVSYEVHDPDPNDYFPLAIGDKWTFEWTTNSGE
jgi:hypothetical protein